MIKTIALSLGYAEASSVGQLIFSNRIAGPPMEAEEAVKTLAEDLYALYVYECVPHVRDSRSTALWAFSRAT